MALTPSPDTAPAPWPPVDDLPADAGVRVPHAGGMYAALKGLFDYAAAAVLLVPALPVIGACWLAVRLTSRGPGFYAQTRLGKHGRPYKIIKLRSMRLDAEVNGAMWSHGKTDPRITRVGAFLRATHLDELPQLFNVLMGHMSLVGPRPERPEMIAREGLNTLVPGYAQRLRVRPGVTGFAQVQLPADTHVAGVRHKVAYDLYYIAHVGLLFDVRIVAATLLKSCGVGPARLRRLFLLPRRERVGESFARFAAPPTPPDAVRELQPA